MSSSSTTAMSSSSGSSSSSNSKTAQCVLDPALVNKDTLPLMKNVGLSIFASACSKNRGAFVLHPPDGQTYGCLAFPQDIMQRVGIDIDMDSANFTMANVEDITKHFQDGNLTSAETVQILDFLVENVYASTPNVDASPYACDVSGVVTLQCDHKEKTTGMTPIRAVTMAGVFTPALWATGGEQLTLEQATTFYTAKDFKEMKKLGLNTVQIPIPTKIFSANYKHAGQWKDLLLDTLGYIRSVGLDVILVLDQGDSPPEDVSSAVVEAAKFAQDYNAKYSDDRTIIVALTLPSLEEALLQAATLAAPDLNVWIPTKGGDFKDLHKYPQAAAASLELSHTATVADIASSTSQEDRAKLFYHESTACITRAPLEYSACYQGMPVMLATGFDLAIDDCHMKAVPSRFNDYGQCNRFNETIHSNWWQNHRFSFAARQLFVYEQGMGWSFSAWKLFEADESKLGVLDAPNKLLSFREVAAAGLIPSLFDLDEPIAFPLNNQSSPVGLACLNPPVADFAMGDATLAPTPAPPPSCGNGWWNFTTEKCDYWIPPTPAPTPACPVCSNETVVVTEPLDCPDLIDYANDTLTADGDVNGTVVKAFFGGAVVATLVCALIVRFVMPRFDKRRGYEAIPTNGHSYANGNGHNGNGYHA